MSRKYKFWDSQKMYFISFATVYWIDVFIRNEYKDEPPPRFVSPRTETPQFDSIPRTEILNTFES